MSFNIRTLLLLTVLVLSSTAHATDWIYLDAGASRTTIDVDGTDFKPVVPRIKLGVAIYNGILLEYQLTGSGDDTSNNTTIEIEQISAAYLRLDTPIRSSMRMFVLLGAAETQLNVKGAAGATGGTDTYEDFSWGVGLEDRTFSKHTLLTLEYTEYYKHDDVQISAVSLGFKLEF